MTNVIKFFLSLAIGLASSFANAAPTYSQLVVFGDSLSADSYTYTPTLASRLNATLSNYAVGGATSWSMLSRLQNEYLASSPTINSSSAFLINIGLNDGWSGYPVNQSILNQTILNISQMVTLLSNKGATDIYLTDFMNRGRNPGIAAFAASENLDFNFVANLVGAGSIDASNQLFAAVASVNPNVHFLGIADVMASIEQNMVANGFAADSIGYCYSAQAGCTTHPVYGENGTSPNIEMLLYGDRLHPTGHTHRLIADGLYAQISAVPEPETYTMLLAGFGFVGAIARRRKAKQTA